MTKPELELRPWTRTQELVPLIHSEPRSLALDKHLFGKDYVLLRDLFPLIPLSLSIWVTKTYLWGQKLSLYKSFEPGFIQVWRPRSGSANTKKKTKHTAIKYIFPPRKQKMFMRVYVCVFRCVYTCICFYVYLHLCVNATVLYMCICVSKSCEHVCVCVCVCVCVWEKVSLVNLHVFVTVADYHRLGGL